MTDDTNPFASPEWVERQRAYLDAIARGLGEAAAGSDEAESPPPWRQAMEEWTQAVMDTVPAASKAVYGNLLAQCESFYSINDRFAGMLRELSAEAGGDEEWQSILAAHMALIKRQIEAGGDGAVTADPDESLEAWQRDWWQAARYFSPEGFLSDEQDRELQRLFQRYLTLPAVGPFREYQDKARVCLDSWLDFQGATRQYQTTLQRLGVDAVDRLQEKILALADEDRKITRLRQLYDLWIDCNEEAFSEYAGSDEYAALYGRVVSSFMAFRRQSRALTDDLLRQFAMPDSQSLEQLRQLQDDFRQVLQESSMENRRMRDEIESLRREVEELRSTGASDSATGESGEPGTGPRNGD